MTAHRDQWALDSAAMTYAEGLHIARICDDLAHGPQDDLSDFLRALNIVADEIQHTDTELQDARDYLRRTLFEWDGQV